ncbi:hyaluronidase-like [Copidosoma floridanum]|uniref:hyaluronidase-like n=1 Tax=Copidosoma floridanum TaxID=29053 RepID=UPI0006C96F86|nr:hyaluronidase-like [Copidosoma floridanum]
MNLKKKMGDWNIFATSTPYAGVSDEFQFYWNVPTFMCHKYGMDFTEVSQNFSIVQNEGDDFRGDRMAILYDPGDFPALLRDDKGNVVKRNGGVPQQGNLTLHLDHFRRHVEEQIQDPEFSGVAVIDFESWRPIFRQNWASLQIYRELSYDVERQLHPFWSQKAVQQEAADRFEKSARMFMQRSLELARALRPRAGWGYYAYPYCFNWTPNQQSAQCSSKAVEENDGMSWLFGSKTNLYPSVYLRQKLNASQRIGLVRGRVQEAVRLSRKAWNRESSRVLPYYWYKYQDQTNVFVNKRDLTNTLTEAIKRGADGVVIWGSSNDFNSQTKCRDFYAYLMQILGPTVYQLKQQLDAQ